MLDPHFAAEGIVPKDETGTEARLSTPCSKHLHLSRLLLVLPPVVLMCMGLQVRDGGRHRDRRNSQALLFFMLHTS